MEACDCRWETCDCMQHVLYRIECKYGTIWLSLNVILSRWSVKLCVVMQWSFSWSSL